MKTSSSQPFAQSRLFEYGAVIFGGAAGSMLRGVISPQLPDFSFLTSTFFINIAACFVLGWLFAARHRLRARQMLLWGVGFCGGLSTFSSFAADVFHMLMSGAVLAGILAPMLEIGFGVFAAMIGEALGRHIHGRPAS